MRPLAVAAAILIATLIPAVLWLARPARQHESASVAGLAQLNPSDQAQVRAALDAGVARLPDFIDDLTGSRETLMSPAGPAVDAFALVSPLATGTPADRPTFRWHPLAGAASYVVTVFDEQSNEVMHSAPIGQTSWVPDTPLLRGRTYVWQVAARRSGGTVVAPTAPTPPAKFHVVDAHTAGVLERAQSERPSRISCWGFST